MKAFIFAIALLLLLGCASTGPGNNSSESPPANASVSQPAANASPQAQPPEAPQAQAPPAAGSAYSGKTFPELVALDVPLECDINYTYQGRPGQSKVYMKGADELRVETVGGSGMSQCSKTISIARGTRVYVGCDGKMIMPSCDWFRSDYDPSQPGVSSTFNFKDLPPSQIFCKDWEYDSSAFDTPGNSCHL